MVSNGQYLFWGGNKAEVSGGSILEPLLINYLTISLVFLLFVFFTLRFKWLFEEWIQLRSLQWNDLTKHALELVLSRKVYTTYDPQSNFIEFTLRQGCSLVNFLRIFRTPFHKNTSGDLLLKILKSLSTHFHQVISVPNESYRKCFHFFNWKFHITLILYSSRG